MTDVPVVKSCVMSLSALSVRSGALTSKSSRDCVVDPRSGLLIFTSGLGIDISEVFLSECNPGGTRGLRWTPKGLLR